MTHAEVKALFTIYHAETWPERMLFDNPTGWAQFKGQWVPYGIPPPLKGKKRKDGGGGADLISLGNEDGYFTAWFFEVKTIGDDIRPNQIRVADTFTGKGAKYWIVKETEDGGFRLIRYR
ncbi:hypothetical protein AMJ80_06625 [bacterium SM23_31]|nr:MAG: hypothetical protein AMJ80_06625 [bacterium SM23_31]